MTRDQEVLSIFVRHGVEFFVIGGHAVNFHGFVRATEDVDIVWLRPSEPHRTLLAALIEMDAKYLGKEIDPSTGIERAYPVTSSYIQANHLLMLWTRLGFVDVFDYIPGFPSQNVREVFDAAPVSEGIRYAPLDWLRRMKAESGRPRDLLDLENLPEPEENQKL